MTCRCACAESMRNCLNYKHFSMPADDDIFRRARHELNSIKASCRAVRMRARLSASNVRRESATLAFTRHVHIVAASTLRAADKWRSIPARFGVSCLQIIIKMNLLRSDAFYSRHALQIVGLTARGLGCARFFARLRFLACACSFFRS